MTIEELKDLEIPERIKELKSQSSPADKESLLSDWDENKHDVMLEAVRPKRKVALEPEVKDFEGRVIKQGRYKHVEVNRIALPIEQDIVNIQTAFTVGSEPKLTCDDKESENVFRIIRKIHKDNKLKYQNKKVVRSWLSETEVAEYWYTVEKEGFWQKLKDLFKSNAKPKRTLKSVVWSPFRGDKLYPYFDTHGDMVAFSREYKVKEEGKELTKLMVIDAKEVVIYVEDEEPVRFLHGFEKIPVVYMKREKPYCEKIKTMRSRLETLLSNFADCLDYNFYPKLMASGIVQDIQNRGTVNELIQLENGGQVAYLTWQQSPDMAKLEFDNLTERIYSLTNTPRISFENLKGTGNALSGVAFKFAFMGAHMQVSNHAEDVELFLQRRINFLLSAIGSLAPALKPKTEEADIEVELVPYMIDNKKEEVDIAVSAVGGGVASVKQGIILAGITDAVEEELALIKESEKKDVQN